MMNITYSVDDSHSVSVQSGLCLQKNIDHEIKAYSASCSYLSYYSVDWDDFYSTFSRPSQGICAESGELSY